MDKRTDLSKFWPIAGNGAVLITTRSHTIGMQGVSSSIEIPPFSQEETLDFFKHLLPDRKIDSKESEAALELNEKLGGHALAINQIAAFLNARRMTLTKFLSLYGKQQKKYHREKKDGWKAIGYLHSLDTVWQMSFDELSASATTILGVLCFLVSDAIPEGLFEPDDSLELMEELEFCQEE